MYVTSVGRMFMTLGKVYMASVGRVYMKTVGRE